MKIRVKIEIKSKKRVNMNLYNKLLLVINKIPKFQ